MAYKKFYPKYRKKAVAKKRVYKKKTVSKPSIKMMIKKALDRRIENKTVSAISSLFIFQAGTATLAPSAIADITPTISQGTTESGRIGNQCKLKNGYLRGFLRYNTTGVNAVNIYVPSQFCVRLFIGKLKDTNDIPTSSDLGSLLRSGSTTTGFDSANGLSLCRPVNKDLWTIHYDKVFKLGAGTHSTGNATFSTLTGIANNDYKLNYMVKIPLTKMLKKTLMFNDAANIPTNTTLFMFAGIVDCLASDTVYGSPVALMDFDVEYSYEDA